MTSQPIPMILTPQGPTCGQCGYLLSSHALGAACPECGSIAGSPLEAPAELKALSIPPFALALTLVASMLMGALSMTAAAATCLLGIVISTITTTRSLLTTYYPPPRTTAARAQAILISVTASIGLNILIGATMSTLCLIAIKVVFH